MLWDHLRRIAPILLLAVLLSACRYPATDTPVPLASSTKPVLPSPISLAFPTPTIPPTQTQPTPEPSSTEPNPVNPVPSETIIPPLPSSSYGVILIPPTDALHVYRDPNTASEEVHAFAFDETGISLTGSQKQAGNTIWAEVLLPGGGTGWVNRQFLTESVPAVSFCADPAVQDLLILIKDTLTSKDGLRWRDLVSPVHGLNIQYLRGGTVANYSPEEARWMFGTTYVLNWGMHPGSGLDVKGTFKDEVLPKLMDVYRAEYTVTCNDIRTGGTTYQSVWSEIYRNINFITVYRPGPPDQELDWRTLLLGIEYVEGKPYLFAINHLFWEP